MTREKKENIRKEIDLRAKIFVVVDYLIQKQDYVGLQRLYARLACSPTFDEHVKDGFVIAAAMADDSALHHAAQFAAHVDAMGDIGKDWRG